MSRLDRLVVLLDTGSSVFVRNTAADQLAETQKSHPEELLNLLERVLPYLKSRKWETRVAAARAIGGIANYAPKWEDQNLESTEPTDHFTVKTEEEVDAAVIKSENDVNIKVEESAEIATREPVPQQNLLSFDKLDMKLILRLGNKLVGSAGKEYDDPYSNLDPVERLRRQKLGLQQKLGMDFMDDDLLNEGDVKSLGSRSRSSSPPPSEVPPSKRSTAISRSSSSTNIKAESLADDASSNEKESPALARKRALAKRRAKSEARNASKAHHTVSLTSSIPGSGTGASDTKVGTNSGGGGNVYDVTQQADANKVVVEHRVQQRVLTTDNRTWPFEMLCQILISDLFADAWEVRHGAAMGLREVIRVHGAGAGRVLGVSNAENNRRNKSWLENLTCSLCCVFALDRFGDYLSDQVVAPVRESAAQTLGAALLYTPDDVARLTFDTLQQLVLQTNLDLTVPIWEVCHGGMLGLKYFVSVRKECLSEDQLDQIIVCALHGLNESDDDVQACAAATLLPITDELVAHRSAHLPSILDVIWSCLNDLTDDLSASIGNVMDLLAKLCTYPQVLDLLLNSKGSLSLLVPRLYPFLRHSITNVRKSVLKALSTFATLSCGWIDGKALRLVFQNMLVEQNADALELSFQLWRDMIIVCLKSTSDDQERLAGSFQMQAYDLFKLLQTPIGASRTSYKMDRSLFLRPSGVSHEEQRPNSRKRKLEENQANLRVNIDNPMLDGDVTLVDPSVIIRCRISSATAFGSALAVVMKESQLDISQHLLDHLQSPFSTARMITGLVFEEYGKTCVEFGTENHLKELPNAFLDAISTSPPFYRNIAPYLKTVRSQCQALFDTMQDLGKIPRSKFPSMAVVTQGDADAGPDAFSLAQAESISNELFPKLLLSLPVAKRTAYGQVFDDAHRSLQQAIAAAGDSKHAADIQVHATIAAAYIHLSANLPKKLNPLIRSLMDSIKTEENGQLQLRSAHAIAYLIKRLLDEQGGSMAIDKVVKNLCVFLCVDTSEVPEFEPNSGFKDIILSLRKEEAKADAADQALHQQEARRARIKRKGAIRALERLAELYGPDLFDKLPKIHECMTKELEPLALQASEETPSPRSGQPIIDALAVIRAMLPSLQPELYDQVLPYAESVLKVMSSEYSVLRYSAAKCFATMCSVVPGKTIPILVKEVLPMLVDAGNLRKRQGAIECVYHLTLSMGVDILPYVVFLIVPVLGRMSDSDNDIRLLATTTFASIIKLVPLESGIPDPVDMPRELLQGREKEREFISQMLDPTKASNFKLPVAIKADLRKYQQAGVNWLAFLNKYHLHGILCDDMGLGKTLQTICIVASDHHQRAEQYALTQSEEMRKLPSLVVCPPSLTGHWKHEINTYAPFLKVLVYVGSPSWRSAMKGTFSDYDVVVTSYDIARNDVIAITRQNWNYCVLDEGHVIKNAASKLTKAVKLIKANHRLILSGTPIQNNVLELWSLFDFLMPGFLGTEKVFNERFARPIAASRSGKGSAKDQESGALALEILHKQVLPFLLRRLKEDVLSDLPPKIIQDYYCELSELQKSLYESFVNKEKAEVTQAFAGGKESQNTPQKQHVFQALQYMRKLCNHPALVVNANHPLYNQVTQSLKAKHQTLRDIVHAPKLQALKELLQDCGIGLDQTPSNLNSNTTAAAASTDLPVTSQHRALIFCQLKDMLNMVENDLLKKLMPGVSYMRLDGSTEASKRQDIVAKFNSDPSIDVLLLTTHVGGLGLNLTGADTVIFVEHDWNPMNDLQAMDRAHRIGQKKVVNVYRLITRNTLEEKIMGLQKFKMNIASTIINQQNSGLASMGTDQLFDLFSMNEDASDVPKAEQNEEEAADRQISAVPKAVGELEELWGDQQYVEEYNLDNFIQTLRN